MSSLEGAVVPDDGEGEDFAVVIDVLFESVVGVSSSESDLDVLLVLFGVRRVDLGFLGPDESVKEVVR